MITVFWAGQARAPTDSQKNGCSFQDYILVLTFLLFWIDRSKEKIQLQRLFVGGAGCIACFQYHDRRGDGILNRGVGGRFG